MQDQITFGVPEWFPRRLHWEAGASGGGLGGRFRAETDLPRNFEVDAQLRIGQSRFDRIFQFVGRGTSHNNTIFCTFNMGVYDHETDHDVIVGVWSGRSDRGLPTVAPMVLSRAPLRLDAVKRIVDKVSSRYLPNAEAGDLSDRFTAGNS